MTVYGLDPGTRDSALARLYDDGRVEAQMYANEILVGELERISTRDDCAMLVVEQLAGMGQVVGGEVLETAFWSGQFVRSWRGSWTRIKRVPIKVHLCGTARSKDADVRRALIDRWGGPDAIKKGGPLYRMAGDEWSALAVAVTWRDLNVRMP